MFSQYVSAELRVVVFIVKLGVGRDGFADDSQPFLSTVLNEVVEFDRKVVCILLYPCQSWNENP